MSPAWSARAVAATALLLACLLLVACSPRHLLVRGIADELAGQYQVAEEDSGIAREAAAFYLKLAEGLLREQPGHGALATAVAAGFTQYAYAFVAFEADRVESRDARAARALRDRAAALYRRAQRHALTALEARQPGFAAALAQAERARWPTLDEADVALAYWGAAAWGGAISLSKDDPDTVADLPLAQRLAQLAYERAPQHGNGALASLMGSFEAGRPGGSSAQALRYFDEAIALGKGRQSGPYVAKAEAIALPAGDRAAFEALLRQGIAAAARQRDLPNTLMRERAEWLLSRADELF